MIVAGHLIAAALAFPTAAHAADVQVVAVMNGRATLIVNGGRPRTLSAGQSTPEGVRLVSVSPDSAVVEVGGARHAISMGSSYRMSGSTGGAGPLGQSVSITADREGHFLVTGTVNNTATLRFLVDTGASLISISADDAMRAGINYVAGERSLSQTASGVTPIYRVKLDSVRIGDIVVYNVDAAVHTSGRLPISLLGMSFLNRMEMRREGSTLTLTRRY